VSEDGAAMTPVACLYAISAVKAYAALHLLHGGNQKIII